MNGKPSSQTGENEADSLWLVYLELLEQVTLSAYHLVSERLNELRKADGNPAIEAARRLIAARIAIKKGTSADDLPWLEAITSAQAWFGAEASFVLGLHDYHTSRFAEGQDRFVAASAAFNKLGLQDRATLAAYNAFIGRVRCGLVAGPAEQLAELNVIAREIQGLNDVGSRRVLAMVQRQKSHVYEELGRLRASLEEIKEAAQVFALTGPASDFHLSLLHAADLSLDLDDNERALYFVEQVIEPVDTRVEFPLRYVKWRLGGPTPIASMAIAAPTGWKEKFERLATKKERAANSVAGVSNAAQEPLPEFVWQLDAAYIHSTDSSASGLDLRSESLEGKLIRLLMQSRASKSLLIEALWPEHVSVHHIDNRLHRMIGRINKKFGVKLIAFDGHFYRLKALIHLR
jgi:hypothetical protein